MESDIGHAVLVARAAGIVEDKPEAQPLVQTIGLGADHRAFERQSAIEIDDRGIQMLLREISTDVLVTALKGADNALKEKVFKNMSKRAGEMLRDDLESKGPVRLSEVEEAQKEIIAVARRLTDSGEISLGGKGEEFVS